jgi:hypothetical protein
LSPRPRRALALAFVILASLGCDAPRAVSSDAGVDGSAPPQIRPTGPLPSASEFTCGSQLCEPPAASPLDPEGCCGDAGSCGRTTRFTRASCLATNGPGAPTLECPPLDIVGGPLLQGCCTPEGTCGIFDRFGDLGCIPASALGREAVSCQTPVEPSCRHIVEVPCDGPEDCGPGLQCCGRVADDHWDGFGCFPDCRSVQDGRNSVWLPLCHPGQPCDEPTHECAAATALPAPLARCHVGGLNAGPPRAPTPGILCGELTCHDGEKCCLAPPLPPHCSPTHANCACTPAGLGDAGTDRNDAGLMSGASSFDGDRDASL